MHDQLLIFKIKIMLFNLKYSGVKNRPIHLTVDLMITEMFNTICRLIYPGYISLFTFCNCITRDIYYSVIQLQL